MTKIRRAVLIGRRTDRDQDHLTVRDAGRRIGREGQTTRSGIAGDQGLQPGFVDRHLAALQALDLVRIDVDAEHAITRIGEAGARDEPDITGTEDRDAHGYRPRGLFRRWPQTRRQRPADDSRNTAGTKRLSAVALYIKRTTPTPTNKKARNNIESEI